MPTKLNEAASASSKMPEETVEARSQTSLRVRRFLVRVVRGPDVGTELASRGESLVVGKHAGADLVLDDPLVSRRHLELCALEDGVMARDLGSKNGSFLDRIQFREIVLHETALISVGKTVLQVDVQADFESIEIESEMRFGQLWGKSLAMRRVFHLLGRAARSRSAVLLRGEVGTGKRTAAYSLHAATQPALSGECVRFDCSGVTRSQQQAELFDPQGALAQAQGGTLILSEVGDLSAEAQGQLVRMMDGESSALRGVRLIATTSQDLQVLVNRREFLPELYYWLSTLVVMLPPLRERREDTAGLVHEVLRALHQQQGLSLPAAKQTELIDDAQTRAWPGNLRELRAFIENFAVFGKEDEGPGPLSSGPTVNTSLPLREERDRWNRVFEVQYVTALLEQQRWNVAVAARQAGIEREYLHRLIRRHNIQRPR